MKKEKLKDVIAGIFSVIFIAIVFYLYFIRVFSGLGYIGTSDDNFVVYNQTLHNSCHITVTEPTIVLRMDDVRAYSKITKPLVDEILDKNISITLGVIPKDLEKDKNIVKYLIGIKTNPLIELAQHGTYHNESDKNITNESLVGGYVQIQKVLGVLPVTYIPPYNEISQESKEIVSNYFRIISSGEGITKEGEKFAEIDYTEQTYWYDQNENVPIEKIIDGCRFNLDNTNLCVVVIHPQEYAVDINNPTTLSNEKFDNFKELLTQLQELNARFSTFKDLVECSS